MAGGKPKPVKFVENVISLYVVLIVAYFASFYAAFRTFVNVLSKKSIFGIFAPPATIPLPPAELADPLYGKNSYVQIKGIKLHFLQKPSTNYSSKPLLLLLHSSPDFWYSFRNQISHLSEYYWVIALDLRGSGDSEKPSGVISWKYYKYDRFVEDIKNLLPVLGKEKATLIGYQFGGTILYEFVMKYPELVEKYVTLNAVPSFGIGFTPALFKLWFEFFSIIPILPEIYLKQFDLYFVEKLYRKEGGDAVIQSYKFAFSKPGTLTYSVNYYRANIVTTVSRLLFGFSIDKKDYPAGLALYGQNSGIRWAKIFRKPSIVPNLSVKEIQNGTDLVHQIQYETVNKNIDQFLGISPPAESSISHDKSPITT